jgi:hypothetical protein
MTRVHEDRMRDLQKQLAELGVCAERVWFCQYFGKNVA